MTCAFEGLMRKFDIAKGLVEGRGEGESPHLMEMIIRQMLAIYGVHYESADPLEVLSPCGNERCNVLVTMEHTGRLVYRGQCAEGKEFQEIGQLVKSKEKVVLP